MPDNDDVIATLNDLIETCKNGEEGFRTAANSVQNRELSQLFAHYAQQRARFLTELQHEVRRLGGDPETSGTTGASFHRGWINIKSAITGGDEGAIISECERGEDAAVKNYQEALKCPFSQETRALVNRQAAEVQQAHDTIRELERREERKAA